MKKYSMENKPSFADQEKVLVDMSCFGFSDKILEGKIIGKSFTHVIDNWIIQFDCQFAPTYPYSALPVPHTFIIDQS
jgi:hypothetical protein